MNVREKLVELLKTNACPSPFMCDPACRYYGFEDCFPDRFADHLIAHGVTVQEWISVKDRLPKDGRYLTVRYDHVTRSSFVDILWFERGDWWNRHCPGDYAVTHWMPLPQPPKGE